MTIIREDDGVIIEKMIILNALVCLKMPYGIL